MGEAHQLRAETVLETRCTCAGVVGPAYCDLHSSGALLELLERRQEDQEDRDDADEAKRVAEEEAKEMWEARADTLRAAVILAAGQLEEGSGLKKGKKEAFKVFLGALDAAFKIFKED